MRQVRRQPLDGALICLAATDPANLLGTVVPGPKVARVTGSRVAFRDGIPLATSVAGHGRRCWRRCHRRNRKL